MNQDEAMSYAMSFYFDVVALYVLIITRLALSEVSAKIYGDTLAGKIIFASCRQPTFFDKRPHSHSQNAKVGKLAQRFTLTLLEG